MNHSVSDSTSSTADAASSDPAKPKPREPGVGKTRSREDILAAQAIVAHGDVCKVEGMARSISGQR